MAISGSPKMLAYDIAKGVIYFSSPMLRQYTADDLKTIMTHIGIVQREIRGEQVPLEDIMAIKGKNQKLHRLSQAVSVITAYAKQRRMTV